MKLKSLIMFSAAALAFAACSNDEDFTGNDGTFDGPGAVSVKITTADLTRMAGGATSGADGGKVDITGDLTVTLTGKKTETAATDDYQETITIDAAKVNGDTKLTFLNIAVPTKLTVSINGGVADYTAQGAPTLVDLQVAEGAAKIPAYGETTDFTKTDASSSPVLNNDNDTTEDGTEQGAVSGDEDKEYQLYSATVTMAIPVARLEVSNIMHVKHEGEETCQYKTLVANGAYLDGLTTVGSKYNEETGAYAKSTGQALDYSYNGTDGTGDVSPLKDMIGTAEAGLSFLSEAVLAGPFTYNFFVNGTNPIFKLYFGTAVAADGADPVSQPRYAMITNYKKEDGTPVTFEAGKIYRITEAELSDKNILGDEGGNTLWGVEVTVVEAQWDIVNIEADWAE